MSFEISSNCEIVYRQIRQVIVKFRKSLRYFAAGINNIIMHQMNVIPDYNVSIKSSV